MNKLGIMTYDVKYCDFTTPNNDIEHYTNLSGAIFFDRYIDYKVFGFSVRKYKVK